MKAETFLFTNWKMSMMLACANECFCYSAASSAIVIRLWKCTVEGEQQLWTTHRVCMCDSAVFKYTLNFSIAVSVSPLTRVKSIINPSTAATWCALTHMPELEGKTNLQGHFQNTHTC